jgi:hypothetical protein
MDIKTKMNLMDIGFRMRRLSDEELRKSLDRISKKVMTRVVTSMGPLDETPVSLEELEF